MNELKELIEEYNSLGIKEQIDYDKFYLYSIITHSTAIEGSTVTEIENRLLFDEGIGSSKPMSEQLMNLDLKNAYERAFEIAGNHEEITVELLCELSGIVMKNTGSLYNTMTGSFDSSKGELRLVNVSAGRGGKSYLSWKKIPDSLNKFCEWLQQERAHLLNSSIEHAYSISFEVHYRLVSIHPWADGNGRMARLLMNLIQYEAGVIPSIVNRENRIPYMEALAEAQEKKDWTVFRDYMFQNHMENLRRQISSFKQSLEGDETLNDTFETLNGTLNDSHSVKASRILSLVKNNPSITISEILGETGYSRSTVNRIIKELKEQRILVREGSKKSGKWKVN